MKIASLRDMMRFLLPAVIFATALWAQPNTEKKDSFYFEGNKIFATSDTKFQLISADELSKLSFIEYKLNSQPFRKYFGPISIVEEGEHRLL